jgi:hypothetical protein
MKADKGKPNVPFGRRMVTQSLPAITKLAGKTKKIVPSIPPPPEPYKASA